MKKLNLKIFKIFIKNIDKIKVLCYTIFIKGGNIYTIYGFNKEEIINQLNICYLYEKENIEIAKYIVDNIDSKDINYSIDKLKRYTIKEYEPKRIKEIKKIAEKYAKTLDKKNN